MRKATKTRKRACARKQKYANGDEAWAEVDRQRASFGAGYKLMAYRCDVGQKGVPRHWHLGHR